MLEAGLRIVTYDWVKARRTRDQDVQNLQKGGGMRAKKQLERLGRFLLDHFPDEIGKGHPEGESAVDMAIRLLREIPDRADAWKEE